VATPADDASASDASARRFRLFDAVATFLRRASERAPLVLVLDDLHWADAPSLRLLRFVGGALPEIGALVIATYRDVEVDAAHPQAEALGACARVGDRLALRGLARDEVARFLEAVTGGQPVPEVVDAVHARTDGNPFFVRELAGLVGPDGRLASGALPLGVAHAIRERLARLGSPCRRLLELAAVAGREFMLDVLGEDGAGIAQTLAPALAARLVEPPAAQRQTWRFVHALVRDAVYEGLPASERARLHLVVAQAIEARCAERPEVHVAELAHHYAEAASLAGPGCALHYATRAAERSRDLLAYEDAAVHYESALRFLDAVPKEARDQRRLVLLLALADVELPAGRRSAARRHYLEAADLARALDDHEALAHVALGHAGRGDLMTAPDPVVTGLLEEALARLPPHDGVLRARLMSRLADALLVVPEARARREALTRDAVAMADRLGDVRTLGIALVARRIAIWDPDRLEDRLAVTARMIALGVEAHEPELELGGRFWRVIDRLEAGDIVGVDDDIAAYTRLATALRQPLYLWQVPSLRAMRALLDGRFEDAELAIEEARREGERAESPNVAFRSAVHLFALRRAQGRTGELEPLLRAAVARLPGLAALRVSLALASVEAGRDLEARAQLEHLAADDFARVPRDGSWLAAMCHLALVTTALGDTPRTALLYEQLLPYADRVAVVSLAHGCEGAVARFLAVLAASLGRFDEAERHFEHALARNTALGAPALVAETRAAWAAMRSREGAREPARSSTNVFRREGEIWTVGFGGATSRLRGTKGLAYIAHLLQHPGRDVHVADLAGVDDVRFLHAAGRDAERPDARARAAYRTRLESLREAIDAAEEANDVMRASALRAEMDRLAAELAGHYGLHARRRAAADPVEKIRKAVTNRIRHALARIRTAQPALGRHLGRSIRTGVFCAYRPDEPVPRWEL
jgi:tetratricopeptide (TPR) repeat protein